ncbi:hypothetical protein LOTGIDRAFT_232445 [Lottia gigantea]|uniref:Uncharacterized protein n=1 Tax=Lottia gigantea TaxID=225164 RepID=V4AG92_LOTGI|nr:hypothetical protein LOTGIDRAFT_232445 [Lottia gigantea]ESO94185.1 hypothetical protein LOTGIDRAFT_232445 [Lottia gigantea]
MMSTNDNQSKPRLLKTRNLFEKGDSTSSSRDVGLIKMGKSSETKVIPLKTTGIRVPGNHRRDSYILQTDLKEVRGLARLKRFNNISKESSTLRKSKITPSSQNDKHQNNFEMTSLKSNSVNQRFDKTSKISDAESIISIVLKISVIVSLLALFFHAVAISLTMWMSSEFSKIGLWEICIVNICGRYKYETQIIQAGQAFNVLGFLAGGAAVLLIILYIFCLNNKNIVRLFGMIAAFLAGGFILVGIIIIGTSDSNQGLDVGSAMILAIIGAVLYVTTGILLVVDIVQNKMP